MDQPPSDSDNFIIEEHSTTIEQSNERRLLQIGIFSEVYLLNETVIRKITRSESEEHAQPILREATIYTILGGPHPRIANCLSRGITSHVDIEYYSNGDLATYKKKNKLNLEPDLQIKWFMQIIEAVAKIHDHSVIHSDLALRQFFLDNYLNVRLGDFNSSQYPGHIALGYEKASHCLPRDYNAPNTIMSDLFALGSTLYELVAGKGPYSELNYVEPEDVLRSTDHTVIQARIQREQQIDLKIEERYRNQDFPDVDYFGGEIIMGCWKGSISSAKEALTQCMIMIQQVNSYLTEDNGW